MEEKLPSEITWRRDKIGFEPPQKKWMENSSVRDAIREARQKLADENILDSSMLQKQIRPHDAHEAGTADWKFWSAAYLFES